MLNWRPSILIVATAIAGCASSLINLPMPSSEVMNSKPGDYRAFVQVWTGALPRKNFEKPFPTKPSDARLLALRNVTFLDRQLKALTDTFRQWCANSNGAAQRREEDMVSPGNALLVCEAKVTAEKIAALRIYPDPDATREGRIEFLVQHWYPPDIEQYIQSVRDQSARRTAARAQAAADRTAREERDKLAQERALAERKVQDRALLEQLGMASRLRLTPLCQRFERESNALRARFTGTVQRADLARYISDLIVAFDECGQSKVAAPPPLAGVYRFNLESFQFFAEAWDANLLSLSCDSNDNCRPSGRPASPQEHRDMARLQARYTAILLSPPERAEEILARVQTFVLDR